MFRRPAFAAGFFGVADKQENCVGVAGDFDGLGDAAAIFDRIAEFDLVFPPIVIALGNFDAKRMNNVGAVSRKSPEYLRAG